MQDWPSEQTLFNFSHDGSPFRWSWEWVDEDWTEKGAKKYTTVARTIWYGVCRVDSKARHTWHGILWTLLKRHQLHQPRV